MFPLKDHSGEQNHIDKSFEPFGLTGASLHKTPESQNSFWNISRKSDPKPICQWETNGAMLSIAPRVVKINLLPRKRLIFRPLTHHWNTQFHSFFVHSGQVDSYELRRETLFPYNRFSPCSHCLFASMLPRMASKMNQKRTLRPQVAGKHTCLKEF